jgi:hypothetical protein
MGQSVPLVQRAARSTLGMAYATQRGGRTQRFCGPNRMVDMIRLDHMICATLLLTACARGHDNRTTTSDTAFAVMQARGQMVMGVDQYTSAHVFEDLPDGGRIVLDRDSSTDSAGIAAIRAHVRDIATSFREGDFTKPFAVHAQTVPGTDVMTRLRDAISYEARDRPRGAEVLIRTSNTSAIRAVHEFLAFQRSAHRAAGHEAMHMP